MKSMKIVLFYSTYYENISQFQKLADRLHNSFILIKKKYKWELNFKFLLYLLSQKQLLTSKKEIVDSRFRRVRTLPRENVTDEKVKKFNTKVSWSTFYSTHDRFVKISKIPTLIMLNRRSSEIRKIQRKFAQLLF